MHLRRFSAKNVSEALQKVKAELGDDAVILSTKNRSVKKGTSGHTINFVEVIAAVDRELEEAFQKPPATSKVNKYAARTKEDPSSQRLLLSEIDQLKKEIRMMSGLIKAFVKSGGEGGGPSNKSGSKSKDIEKMLDGISSCLGLDKKSEKVLARLLLDERMNVKPNWKYAVSVLKSFIINGVKIGIPAEDQPARCWWAFVGPTGVGKTTTLAKIAARLKFLCKKQGLFICVDSYRMGAQEQLEKYANLMDIPMEVARTNKDLVRLFGQHKEKDFIFVDTTGRNPFSSSHKTELERLFDSVPGLMAQVMLSATSKREDIMGAISFYRQFPLAGWTLTKVDETRSLASSVFPIIEADLPLSYVTNGQRVPEDIRFANPMEIADRALEPLKGLERLLRVHKDIATDKTNVMPETL